MRYSLLSRFQGTLLAAALGEALGAYGQLGQRSTAKSRTALPQGTLPLTVAHLADWHPGITIKHSSALTDSSPWGSAAISCARLLVQMGRWSELEMAAIGLRLAADSMATAAPGQTRTGRAFVSAECALATLPVALFSHDDVSKQQPLLLQTINLWRCPPSTEAGLLAVGYAIAQVLQERVDRFTLVPHTITYLKHYLKQGTANPTAPLLDLIDTLKQVQALLQQGAGLHTAIERLRARSTNGDSTAIALAFYCFLSTPDDLQLSLLRAARSGELASGELAPVTCALTGALSGAYNSLNGLPLAWRTGNPMAVLWGLSDPEMKQLATHLFAVWSGVYNPGTATNRLAIAAPGVIRPR